MRDSKIIISEIVSLLEELNNSLGIEHQPYSKVANKVGRNDTSPKGAVGAINTLIEENFFNTPKEISVILEKLKEIGHFHKSTAIAMNLLNLTKRRVLNRFKNKETKNWEYVIRK
jgi:hypothetical protein